MAQGSADIGTTATQVVMRFLEDVLDKGDLRRLDEMVSDEALRSRVRTLRRAFPDLTVSRNVIATDGGLVAVHLEAGGTHTAMFEGVPATARRWRAACTAIYRVEAGRITRSWDTWDRLAILEQIGGVTRAPGASA
jgi:steroid delta-isomerase-like uncharacterized protein